MALAARLNRRVSFLRRPTVPGQKSPPFAPFLTLWAQYTRISGREALEAGRAADIENGVLRIRDGAQARTITNSDRVTIGGREFAVQAVALPDPRTGSIDLTVSTSRSVGGGA